MSTLQPARAGVPTPVPSAVSKRYWDGCRAGELRYQRCANCGSTGLRPATICGTCHQRTLEWHVSAGRGTLYSWTVVWRAQHPTFDVPYAPAIVQLDEGFWLMSAIIGCEPEDLRPDLPLEVEFHAISDEISLPYFRWTGEEPANR
jgi:uncharacterized OB-fold protein